MLIGERVGLNNGKESGWINPYVSDALIALWDGEWNAGPGKHDPNTLKWVDLSGNHNDAFAPNGYRCPSWESNYAYYENNPNAPVGLFVAASDSIKSASALTIEVCAETPFTSGLAYNDMLLQIAPVGSQWYNGIASIRYNFTGNLSNSSMWYANPVWQSRLLWTNGSAAPLKGTYAFAFPSPNVAILPYRDGGAFTPAENKQQVYYGDMANCTGIRIGYSNGAGTYPSGHHIGKIFSIRLYARALIAEEIAANYAVDKERFLV